MGNTQYKSIHEMFFSNTYKIKAFKECCDKYNMKDVLMIPNLVNSGVTCPQDIWR